MAVNKTSCIFAFSQYQFHQMTVSQLIFELSHKHPLGDDDSARQNNSKEMIIECFSFIHIRCSTWTYTCIIISDVWLAVHCKNDHRALCYYYYINCAFVQHKNISQRDISSKNLVYECNASPSCLLYVKCIHFICIKSYR